MSLNYQELYYSYKQIAFAKGYWTCRVHLVDDKKIEFNFQVIPAYCQSSAIELFVNGTKIEFERQIELTTAQASYSRRLQVAGVDSVIFGKFAIPRDTGRCVIDVVDQYVKKSVGNALTINTAIFNDDEHVDAALRGRSNRADLPNFFLTGYEDYTKLAGLIETTLGHASRPRAVLDWGVGSGRVSRYLKGDDRFSAYGCDIDPVNMSSLHERGFDASRFKQMAPGGPIPFPDQSFDFCFGLSVVTHLTEELQDFYLAEVVRVLKPGGAALFSIHGPMHFFSQINDGRLFADLVNKGIVVVSDSPVLDKGFPEAKEKRLYVNTLHSYAYVLRHWAKFFKYVGITDALSITLHDYVLCRT